MQAAPIPTDDAQRIEALGLTGLLDAPPSEAFNRLTQSAAQLLKVPIALISLVDEKRQWFLSRVGLEVTQTPRDISFCGHVIATRKPLHVVDAWQDPRFADNPLVTGAPHIRSYLGVPLIDDDGHALGTLCVLDHRMRAFTAEEQHILARHAQAVQHLMRR